MHAAKPTSTPETTAKNVGSVVGSGSSQFYPQLLLSILALYLSIEQLVVRQSLKDKLNFKLLPLNAKYEVSTLVN